MKKKNVEKMNIFWRKHWYPISFVLILFFAIFVRFWQVTSYPPSLYWEEVALGYDAYSILKTGKDHLGNLPPLVAFESYGDYKPALYFYLLVPSIAVFGLNEFAVRLPTMLAGVLIVIGTGLLSKELSERTKLFQPKVLHIVTMFVVAISPWAIQFSRAAWESNVATMFIVWAVFLSLKSIRLTDKKKAFLMAALAFLFFALSMYTYHSARVISPLLGLGVMLIWSFDQNIWQRFHPFSHKVKSFLLVALPIGLFFLLLISPILLSLKDPTTQERLEETNIFADEHIAVESNHCKAMAGTSLVTKIVCHRDLFYFREYLANYLTHFSFDFLFVSGDKNLRHSTQFTGELYLTESIFLVLGCFILLKNWRKEHALIFFWLFLAVSPAGLTSPAPHALRILQSMPAFLFIVACGVIECELLLRSGLTYIWKNPSFFKTYLPWSLIVASYLFQFAMFWEFYSKVYPKLYSGAWQYGYKQIIAEVNKRKSTAQNIYFLREMDRPAMEYWFFSKTDPRLVQKIDKTLQKDQGAFLQFENITFVNFIGEARPGIVASTIESMNKLKEEGNSIGNEVDIKDPAGKPIWAVYRLN